MTKKVAVMRGDGIGPEIADSMLRILSDCGFGAEIVICEAGSEQWERNGKRDASYIPDDTLAVLESADACFKGPTTTLPSPNAPRSVAVTLRQKFDLYANIRPTKTYDRLTPGRSLDCVCFREATEGLYTGVEAAITDDSAIAIRKITRKGSRRIAESAADWAKKHGMTKFVAITKRNILKQTDGIFWDEVQRVTSEIPGAQLSEMYIDNMAQQMVVAPAQFSGAILISTNLFMDIISELASGLVGSIGLIYSANMGDEYAMFEAAHGSAPSLAGQNKANPTAAILSGAWMAEYVGESAVRNAVFDAAIRVINEGKYTTSDIGGNASMSRMTDEISKAAQGMLRR